MARKTKKRRQSHGSAWHWKQTDCWYYTLPGTKKRIALFDEQGERIRGKENKEAAEISLAREKLAWDSESNDGPALGQPWLVARVCSDYLVYTERSQNDGSVSEGYHRNATQWLNDLCSYCGALPVSQLKRGQILEWVDQHESWKSPATRRCIIAVVMAAFNRVEEMHGTRKRSLENYLHPAAICEVAPIEIAFGDFDPVAVLVSKRLYENGLHDRPWELLTRRSQNRLSSRAKRWLNTQCAGHMTVDHLRERDPEGEITSWLTTIGQLAQSA